MERFLVKHTAKYLYESQVEGEPSKRFPRPAGKGLVVFGVGDTRIAKKDFTMGPYEAPFDVKKGDKITLHMVGDIATYHLFKVERGGEA